MQMVVFISELPMNIILDFSFFLLFWATLLYAIVSRSAYV